MSPELQALNDLRKSVEEKQGEVLATAEKALQASQQNGTLSAEAKANADKALSELHTARQQLNALEVRLGEAEAAYAALPSAGRQAAPMSIGEQVVNADGMRDALAEMAVGSRSTYNVSLQAALTSLPDSGGSLIAPDRVGLIAPPQMRLTVRDLLMRGQTASNAVEFVRESRFDNNADVVAEGTQKPESELAFEADVAKVATIAHFINATQQVLDDAPMLASYINSRLLYGLRQKEERQLLKGSGVGINIKGLHTAATDWAAQNVTVADASLVDVLRIAMLQIELTDHAADGIVLNPIDWATLELLKENNSKYLLANPFNQTVPRLWGLPVVSTRHMDAGEFLVGAFGQAAQLWDRQSANIVISTENKDNIERNTVTIRAEERLALTIYFPQAFVKGTAAAAVAAVPKPAA